MKLLAIDVGSTVGGGQRRMEVHLRGLAKARQDMDIEIILNGENRDLIKTMARRSFHAKQLNLGRGGAKGLSRVLGIIVAIPKLRAWVIESEPDLICLYSLKALVLLLLAVPVRRKPTVYFALSEFARHGFSGWLQKMFVSQATAIVFNSEFTRRSYEMRGLCDGDVHTIVVYDCIDLARPNSIDALAIDSNKRFRVGYLGRINPRKRLEDLILALDSLATQYPWWSNHAECAIVGGHSPEISRTYFPMIEHLGSRCAVPVRFFGHTNAPEILLSTFDVLVLPSLREPLGRVVIEAYLLGVPVIACGTGGVTEFADMVGRHGITLVSERAPDEIAHALELIRNGAGILASCRQARDVPARLHPDVLLAAEGQFFDEVIRASA